MTGITSATRTDIAAMSATGRSRRSAGRLPNAESKTSQVLWGLAGLLILLVGWQLTVVLTGVSPVVLPSPLSVAQSFVENASLLWHATVVTAIEIIVGFVLATVLGILVAIVLVSSKILNRLIYPLLVLLNSVPKVAVAPLFLIWFGFGALTNVMLALTIAVFPVIINTVLGLGSVGSDYVRLGRVMGANGWRLFFRIKLPAALPSIFAGLKLATSFATIGVIVGEFVAGQEGLGYLAQLTAGQLDTPLTFASIVAMAVLGLVFFYAVAGIEKLVIRVPADAR